jgi:Transposase DDE domain group 1
VAQIRAGWPKVKIRLRADSGFAREELMAWCEENSVDYVFGLARNNRLVAKIRRELKSAQREAGRTGRAARRFKDFQWTTLESWSRKRRVIAKAEWTKGEANPRFIVTSLDRDEAAGQALYEDVHCARGDMENRIKECQADLFADRTPTATMRANQLRLWLASFAYVLVCALRRLALAGTELAKATCGSIRLKLLKIGAQITVSVRRVKIALASSYPSQELFALAHARLAHFVPETRLRRAAA